MERNYHDDLTRSKILKEAANLNNVSESADERVSELTDDLHTTPEEHPIPVHAFCQPNTGDYVAAIYQNKWFIGVIKEVDTDDADYNISFMKASSKQPSQYKWPS